jgi:hypothetical protein
MNLIISIALKLLNENISFGVGWLMHRKACGLPQRSVRAREIYSPIAAIIKRIAINDRCAA